MFCINCGTTLEEGLERCPVCGSTLVVKESAPKKTAEPTDIESTSHPQHAREEEPEAQPEPEDIDSGTQAFEERFEPAEPYTDNFVYVEDYPTRRPGHGRRWLWILLPALLVAAGAAAFFMWFNAPAQVLDRALSAGNYDAATRALTKLSASEQREASERLVVFAQNMVERYNKNEVTYDEAYELVDRVESLFPEAGLSAVMEQLKALEASKTVFATAEEAAAAGDITTAISRFGAVIEADTNYETAQSHIAEIKADYKAEALKKADALEKEKNFLGAVAALSGTQAVLGEDADITARIEALKKAETDAYVTEALLAAEKLADKGDYPSALKVLAESEKKDDRIEKQAEAYKKLYKTQEMERAAELAGASEYEEAVAVLRTLQATLTDDADIAAKIESYEALYPVSLLSLSPVAGSDLSTDLEVTDSAGNAYAGGLSFALYPTAMSATTSYAANGSYRLLNGTWIVESGSDADFVGSVRIYVDDTLVYETNALSVESAPETLNLQISGAGTVRIEASASFDSPRSSGFIYLAGPLFRN